MGIKAKLAERGIWDSYALAKTTPLKVYLYLRADNSRERGGHSPWWAVKRIGFITNKNAAWYEDGSKTFAYYNRDGKEDARLAALAWASERYGIKEWERDPWGGYHPIGAIEAALDVVDLPLGIGD